MQLSCLLHHVSRNGRSCAGQMLRGAMSRDFTDGVRSRTDVSVVLPRQEKPVGDRPCGIQDQEKCFSIRGRRMFAREPVGCESFLSVMYSAMRDAGLRLSTYLAWSKTRELTCW